MQAMGWRQRRWAGLHGVGVFELVIIPKWKWEQPDLQQGRTF